MSSVGKISCGAAKLAAAVIMAHFNQNMSAFGLQASLFGWCYSGERAKSESTRSNSPAPAAASSVRDQKFDDVEPATPSAVLVDVIDHEPECPVCFCEYDHMLHKRTEICRGDKSRRIH